MDPDACFSMLLEKIVHGDWDDAAEYAESLQGWLLRGGFPRAAARFARPRSTPC